MRGDLPLLVCLLAPVLIAPKGCYFGSDMVPLGHNAGGMGFDDEAGAGGEPSTAPARGGTGSGGQTGAACAAGVSGAGESGGTAGGGGAAGVGGEGESGGATGGANSGGTAGSSGGRIVVVLRPH